MTCKLCEWFQAWFGAGADSVCDRIWKNIRAWESAYASDWERQESGEHLELFEQASAIHDTDPEAAFHMLLRAAEAGSPWAMLMVGWHYHRGSFVAADSAVAQNYYYRAICAGSWMATLPYARLLAGDGRADDCETVLQEGIAADFIPAYFELARLRFERSRSRRTCREIRPWLEYASERGHPGAKRLLIALMLRGKYGFRQVLAGIKMAWECAEEDEVGEEAGTAMSAAPAAASKGCARLVSMEEARLAWPAAAGNASLTL